MSRRPFNPHECIAALNNFKKGLEMKGLPFTGEQLRKGLKGCGLPCNNNFFKIFKDSGILQEVGHGKYLFKDSKPIYVGTLQDIKRKYSELCRKYYRMSSRKVANVPTHENEKVEEYQQLPEINPEATIQFAIDLLKEQGYQIFAPVATIYKKL